jgi:hypothetical protein
LPADRSSKFRMLPSPDQQDNIDDSTGRKGLRALRTGLLIAGSALFGGLAVALWNRKALANLRQPPETPNPASVKPDAEDI